ncbi:hypothetical protein FACS189437_07130 [Bacteroidia bacterium]|nr:hypothetical protein FACS189437_07130 [Bacteroidia bacterium]
MKRKNIFVILFILLVLGFSCFLMYNKVRDTQQKKNAYSDIPAFQLPDVYGNVLTEASIQKNKPTLFLFFDPGCELCHSEFNQINANQKSLSQSQLIFFSTLPADSIQRFLENIAFIPASNMYFLVDENEKLVNLMEIHGPPTAIIYDKNGKLLKRFNGPVKIETLIKYLSE